MSWKIQVIADNSGEWHGNALRFATKEEAERSASLLARNWTLVRDKRVVECDDKATDTCDENGKHGVIK
jgi:hypothetical protein